MSTKLKYLLGLSAFVMGAVPLAAPQPALAQKYGNVGDPVELTVGYQPYYTESWSGVVVNGKELWKKHLPEGSKAEFQIGLQGSIIVGQLLADKQQIGYMGDMPAIVSTTKQDIADIRMIAVLGTSKQQCNVIFVRNDAPEFANSKEAVKWLDGKVVAAPHGACTDRFFRVVFEKAGITPAKYFNQNIEVMTTNFKAGKLDGGAIWEPTASKLQLDGIARRVASGETYDEGDAGFLVMRDDLIEGRPDVLRGWLEAELDAQLFLADPANADEVATMAEAQTTGMSKKVLWHSLYGEVPEAQGGGKDKLVLDYIFTDKVRKLVDGSTAFLHEQKKVPAAKLREEAVWDQVAREVLEARGLTSPIGKVEAQPMSAFKE
jgi:NitT/TauT family transport system substrate-binding protein